MTSVQVAFVLVFAVVQLSAAEWRLWSPYDVRRQPVTEPEPMSSPINYTAYARLEALVICRRKY